MFKENIEKKLKLEVPKYLSVFGSNLIKSGRPVPSARVEVKVKISFSVSENMSYPRILN